MPVPGGGGSARSRRGSRRSGTGSCPGGPLECGDHGVPHLFESQFDDVRLGTEQVRPPGETSLLTCDDGPHPSPDPVPDDRGPHSAADGEGEQVGGRTGVESHRYGPAGPRATPPADIVQGLAHGGAPTVPGHGALAVRPTAGGGPSGAVPAARLAQRGSTSACGSRASWRACARWAGRCVSQFTSFLAGRGRSAPAAGRRVLPEQTPYPRRARALRHTRPPGGGRSPRCTVPEPGAVPGLRTPSDTGVEWRAVENSTDRDRTRALPVAPNSAARWDSAVHSLWIELWTNRGRIGRRPK